MEKTLRPWVRCECKIHVCGRCYWQFLQFWLAGRPSWRGYAQGWRNWYNQTASKKMELGLQKKVSRKRHMLVGFNDLWRDFGIYQKHSKRGPSMLFSPSVLERWVSKNFCTIDVLNCHWTVSDQVYLDDWLQICCAWMTDSRLECACNIGLSDMSLAEAFWLLLYCSYHGQLAIDSVMVM